MPPQSLFIFHESATIKSSDRIFLIEPMSNDAQGLPGSHLVSGSPQKGTGYWRSNAGLCMYAITTCIFSVQDCQFSIV